MWEELLVCRDGEEGALCLFELTTALGTGKSPLCEGDKEAPTT